MLPSHLFLTTTDDHLFIQVLYNLLITLDNFSMKRLEESLELTVQHLVDLTHIETSKYLYDKRIIRNKRLVCLEILNELSFSNLLFIHLILAYANLDFGVNRRRSDLSALAYNAYIGLEKVNY